MTRVIPAITIFLLNFVCVLGQTQPAQKTSDRASIRQCFDSYKIAVLNQDGKRAASRVTEGTIEYYLHARDMALKSNEEEVKRLPFFKKLLVLNLRNRKTADDLFGMGPEDTFFYGVQTYVYTNDITKVGLGKIEVVSNKGEAELTVTGLVTRLKFYFIKEGKEWKLDWSNGIAIWSQAMVKTLELAGIDENIYILEWVEPNKGKGLNKDLWQPLMN